MPNYNSQNTDISKIFYKARKNSVKVIKTDTDTDLPISFPGFFLIKTIISSAERKTERTISLIKINF